MDAAFVRHIIDEGEGETVEFKSSFTKEVIETIVAFSNTKGGKIIIGCNDAKKIVGITIAEESFQKWQNYIKQNTDPSVFPTVELMEIENKTIVIVSIDEFPLKLNIGWDSFLLQGGPLTSRGFNIGCDFPIGYKDSRNIGCFLLYLYLYL